MARKKSCDKTRGKDARLDEESFGFLDFFGECRIVQRFLNNKPASSCWFPLKILDAVLRGFAQVVFANNPISGLLVVIGLAIADVYICAAGILASTTATLTAVVFRQPWHSISNGLMTYNGVLVGTVTASLSPPIVQLTHGPSYLPWCLIVLGGIISILVTSGLSNLCKGASLPPMTVPFNLIDLLIFICLPSALTQLASKSTHPLALLSTANNFTLLNMTEQTVLNNQTHFIATETVSVVDWIQVLKGSLVSMGQVYAAEDVACSIVMYAGIVFYSPILAVALFGGSFLASVCGLGLTDNYGAIYSGLWGYNSALTAGAIATTFYIPTLYSFGTAAIAVVFTAAAQRAFSLVLAPAGLPVLTIPFVVSSSIFLAVSSGSGWESLEKAPDGRPPEYQRRRYSKHVV